MLRPDPQAKTTQLLLHWLALPATQAALQGDLERLRSGSWAPVDAAGAWAAPIESPPLHLARPRSASPKPATAASSLGSPSSSTPGPDRLDRAGASPGASPALLRIPKRRSSLAVQQPPRTIPAFFPASPAAPAAESHEHIKAAFSSPSLALADFRSVAQVRTPRCQHPKILALPAHRDQTTTHCRSRGGPVFFSRRTPAPYSSAPLSTHSNACAPVFAASGARPHPFCCLLPPLVPARRTVQACALPTFLTGSLFSAAAGTRDNVSRDVFLTFWQRAAACPDDASRFVFILNPGARDLGPDDFVPLIRYILDNHPGLDFLQDSPEFHARYIDTVIARIFYTVNRSWSGRITAAEIRRSPLLATLERLDEEPDINRIQHFFSYEHFYVIYTSFWKLDQNHDLIISKEELARYGDNGLSSRALDRIFSGAVTRGVPSERFAYADFVNFILSEEDKTTPTAIEYWFRVMDLDGDGQLSIFELEWWYEEQEDRLAELAVEALSFRDCLCQMMDMVAPADPSVITLRDLKRCGQAALFFDSFINVNKFLDYEERDSFLLQKEREERMERGEREPTPWERFAEVEYDALAAEEDAEQDDWSHSAASDDWAM
eukprot:m.56171 g.56171  ORF g.56171 m.56171 type:complete len:606 (-) comp6985_c0_seq3:319-2136(-)